MGRVENDVGAGSSGRAGTSIGGSDGLGTVMRALIESV